MSAPATYEVDISLSVPTLNALTKGGYYLYILLATRITDGAARPTIWGAKQALSMATTITWPAAISVYTSTTPMVSGKAVSVGFKAPIAGGQTLEVAAAGIGTVMDGGPASMITIDNKVSNPFVTGFARADAAGDQMPVFAAPLYGKQSIQAFPLPQALLNFTTKKYAPGTILDSIQPASEPAAAFGQSLLIDMTTAKKRQVSYDINNGWDWNKESWAKTIPANADLTRILIQ